MRRPVFVSACSGAKQRLPTWLGPPVSSSRTFQSVQPAVPLLKSWIIRRPYISPSLQSSTFFVSKASLHPSVEMRCLSGKASYVSFTLSYIGSPPPPSTDPPEG